MKNRYETVSNASYGKLTNVNRMQDNRANLEEIEELKRTILSKDKEIDELKALISANSYYVKAAEDKFNNIKLYAINEKKEKIKAQEALLKSYEKEERLLKAHQKLLNVDDQLIITKKEKIQVQENLLKSYDKEELLLKSYQTLLKNIMH